jgi:hypothetical protein
MILPLKSVIASWSPEKEKSNFVASVQRWLVPHIVAIFALYRLRFIQCPTRACQTWRRRRRERPL